MVNNDIIVKIGGTRTELKGYYCSIQLCFRLYPERNNNAIKYERSSLTLKVLNKHPGYQLKILFLVNQYRIAKFFF